MTTTPKPAPETAADVEARILAARALLRPSPVELGRVPNWFRLRVPKAYGCRYSTAGWAAIMRIQACLPHHCGWLDHYGVATWNGELAFVCEPYGLSPESLEEIAGFAKRIGCRWAVDANSWWFPGRTVRVAFYESETLT